MPELSRAQKDLMDRFHQACCRVRDEKGSPKVREELLIIAGECRANGIPDVVLEEILRNYKISLDT
jgi:hypothetical protein